MLKIAVVVQARRGSTRLPDKIMMPMAGAPLLQRMLERVQTAKLPSLTVVATTTEPIDNAVVELCESIGVPWFRGDEHDLLDRHYKAARQFGADVCVKIPSDCPLIDPMTIDRVIAHYIVHRDTCDFVSTLHPATYPHGQDVEVIPMPVLGIAWREATLPMHREHTTPFIWDQPERFRIGNCVWESGRDYSLSHRWTIDYPEDYEFIHTVYNELYDSANPVFHIDDILRLLERRPDIASINAKYRGMNWYRNHLHELRTIDSTMTKQYPALQ